MSQNAAHGGRSPADRYPGSRQGLRRTARTRTYPSTETRVQLHRLLKLFQPFRKGYLYHNNGYVSICVLLFSLKVLALLTNIQYRSPHLVVAVSLVADVVCMNRRLQRFGSDEKKHGVYESHVRSLSHCNI